MISNIIRERLEQRVKLALEITSHAVNDFERTAHSTTKMQMTVALAPAVFTELKDAFE